MRQLQIIKVAWDHELLNVAIRMEDLRELETVHSVKDLESGKFLEQRTVKETRALAYAGGVVQFRPNPGEDLQTYRARFDTDEKLRAEVLAFPDFAKAREEMEARIAATLEKAGQPAPVERKPIML